MGRRPKPRLEPSFGEGSKDSKNFTAKGNRMVGRKEFLRAANPVALCGEVSGSSSPLGRWLYAEFEAVPQGPAFASLGGVVRR